MNWMSVNANVDQSDELEVAVLGLAARVVVYIRCMRKRKAHYQPSIVDHKHHNTHC